MSGNYPDGCTQSSHDAAFDELGPSPDELFDESTADEARWEADRQCQYPGCEELKVGTCENCIDSLRFCSDHGTRGGDREGGTNAHGNPHGAYAVPSVCWKCGGFNADEGEDEMERGRR